MTRIFSTGKYLTDEMVPTLLNNRLQRSMESVIVLLDEMLGLITNCSCEMSDQEPVIVSNFSVLLQLRFPGKVNPEVTRVMVKYLLCEVLIIGPRNTTLINSSSNTILANYLGSLDSSSNRLKIPFCFASIMSIQSWLSTKLTFFTPRPSFT